MNRRNRNFSESSKAHSAVDSGYPHSGASFERELDISEDEDAFEASAPKEEPPDLGDGSLKRRDVYEDVGAHLERSPSRSRPDASLALHGRMSEVMSEALFEQIAVERSEIAFKEFHDFLAPKVYSVIFRILRSEDDALDILQEVFTTFWNSAPDLYKRHSNISAWILLLARNRAIDETRSARYQKQQFMESYDALEHESVVADTHAPDDRLTAEGLSMEIHKAFEVLSPDQRKIMELVFFGGMTLKSVAENMKMPPGTIRKSVHSSIKKLRRVLKPETAFQFQLTTQGGGSSKRPPKVKRRNTLDLVSPETETISAAHIGAENAMSIMDSGEPKDMQPVQTALNLSGIKKAKTVPKPPKLTADERKARRSSKLHGILDELMKNREAALRTTEPSTHSHLNNVLLSPESILEVNESSKPSNASSTHSSQENIEHPF